MLNITLNTLLQAILQTVTYSDIFDYPLSAREIHRYLTGVRASSERVTLALHSNGILMQAGKYYFLPGRQKIIDIRLQREKRSKQLFPIAFRYGRILGRLPFIRMVALTGSLAVMNISGDEDFDYMLITTPGRLWMGRAFALLLNRFVKLSGHTICPNLILSENALAWPKHDLYSARELCQMIPIAGIDTYQRLMLANTWVKDYLPNAYMESDGLPPNLQEPARTLQTFLEFLLRGKFGEFFEQWEMNRKIERFSRQADFGEETVFNADICQGNFDHHSRRTREALQERLDKIGTDSSLLVREGLG